jgi:hypothetical protein
MSFPQFLNREPVALNLAKIIVMSVKTNMVILTKISPSSLIVGNGRVFQSIFQANNNRCHENAAARFFRYTIKLRYSLIV